MEPGTQGRIAFVAALAALFAIVAIGCAHESDAAPIVVNHDWYVDNSTYIDSTVAYEDTYAWFFTHLSRLLVCQHCSHS